MVRGGGVQNYGTEQPPYDYDTPAKPEVYDLMPQYQHSDARNRSVCGIPLTPAAYIACMLTLAEGIILLVQASNALFPDNSAGSWSGGILGPFAALSPVKNGVVQPESARHAHPFRQVEEWALYVVGVGDVFFSIVGFAGIWFGHNLLPIGWRLLSKSHAVIAKIGAGAILTWRCLVTIACAPWAGIWLAFETSTTHKATAVAYIAAYFLVSLFFCYVLMLAYRQIVESSQHFQEHLDQQFSLERQRLLMHAHEQGHHSDGADIHDHEVEPLLFGCMPLAETVTLYSIVILAGCLWAFIFLLWTSHTAGGWAFFAGKPKVPQTLMLEIPLNLFGAVTAIVGFLGASSLVGVKAFGHKLAVSAVLVFLLSSMLRFSLLITVTGMDLAQRNTCGIYIHWLANFASRHPFNAADDILLHCGSQDVGLLFGIACFLALDAYLIWATFKLWHHSREWTLHTIESRAKLEASSRPQEEAYGYQDGFYRYQIQ